MKSLPSSGEWSRVRGASRTASSISVMDRESILPCDWSRKLRRSTESRAIKCAGKIDVPIECSMKRRPSQLRVTSRREVDTEKRQGVGIVKKTKERERERDRKRKGERLFFVAWTQTLISYELHVIRFVPVSVWVVRGEILCSVKRNCRRRCGWMGAKRIAVRLGKKRAARHSSIALATVRRF